MKEAEEEEETEEEPNPLLIAPLLSGRFLSTRAYSGAVARSNLYAAARHSAIGRIFARSTDRRCRTNKITAGITKGLKMSTIYSTNQSGRISEIKAIAGNALPVCTAVTLAAAIGLVDVQLAGIGGSGVQAGVGIGDQALFFAALLGTGIAQGAASLVARATGANNAHQARVFTSAALLLACALGLIASAATFLFADAFLALFSDDTIVQHSGALYLRLCSLANTPYCLMLTQSAILRASGRSFATILPWLAASAISIGMSISLTTLAPYGRQHTLEFIALAWNLGALAGFVFGQIQLHKGGFKFFERSLKKTVFLFASKKILSLGIPIAATEAAWLSSNFFMYLILAHLPYATEAQAAWTIRLKIEEIAATPVVLAFSMTAAALVGQLFGAKKFDEAKRTCKTTAGVAAAILLALGLFVYCSADALTSYYASTCKTAELATTLLSASVFAYPLMAFYLTAFGALEGAGSTVKPMLAVIAGLFLLRIPMASLLALNAGLGMTGITLSLIISHAAVALLAVSQTKSFFKNDDHTSLNSERSQAIGNSKRCNLGTFSVQAVKIIDT